jgi:hypothetical protein
MRLHLSWYVTTEHLEVPIFMFLQHSRVVFEAALDVMDGSCTQVVYADLSIVEGFAANGRAAITARVYPSAKQLANRIGIYSVAQGGRCRCVAIQFCQYLCGGLRVAELAVAAMLSCYAEGAVPIRVRSVEAFRMKNAFKKEHSHATLLRG